MLVGQQDADNDQPGDEREPGSRPPEGRWPDIACGIVRFVMPGTAWHVVPPFTHIWAPLSLRAFNTTETDEALIAKAAKIGPIRMPKNGKRIPAATGTPNAL